MKYRLSSDWHIDNWPTKTLEESVRFIEGFVLPVLPDDKTTVLLLAGDMVTHGKGWIHSRVGGLRSHSTGRQIVRYLCERFANVVYVPGNHDHYGGDIISVSDRDARWAGLPYNFLVLDTLYDSGELAGGAEGISRYSHEHAGVVGCTLWTDCKGWSYGDAFNDFRLIQCGKKTFTSSEMERLHMKDKLEIARRGEFGGIVMTHHSPSYSQVHSKYAGSGYNSMFHCSDMETVIDLIRPKWWFHGHIHDAMMTVLGCGTTIISNPLGYPNGVEYDPSMLTSYNGYNNLLSITV